ncbi:MAG TPA: DegV family protein [Thermomicrobiales bacterium]|nr:DegV family protein [Thermomicrobiales bacterium]
MVDQERIAIVTDSASDLTLEAAALLGVTVVPLALRFGHDTFLDRAEISTDALVARVEEAGILPATSSPSRVTFERVFRQLASTHDAIIAVLNSSRLSSTVKSATIAAANVRDQIPVEIVDSLNVSYGLGHQVLRAVDLVNSGVPADRAATQLRTEVPFNHVVFFAEELDHLRRHGKVGKAPELLGNILQLKPILRIDEGQVIPFERVRTRAKALDLLVGFTKSLPAIDAIAVIYDTLPDDLDPLVRRLRRLVPSREVPHIQIGPSLAAQVGPGVLGIAIRERIVV